MPLIERQHRGEAAPVGNAACCNHRQRRDRVDHGWQQHHRTDRAADVAAGFDSLRADRIRAEVGRTLGLIGRCDGHDCLDLRCTQPREIGGGVAPGQRDHRRTGIYALGEPRVLIPLRHEVHRERPRGAPPDLRDLRGHRGGLVPGGTLHAEAAGLAHRRDEVDGHCTTHRCLGDRAIDPKGSRERGLDHGLLSPTEV